MGLSLGDVDSGSYLLRALHRKINTAWGDKIRPKPRQAQETYSSRQNRDDAFAVREQHSLCRRARDR